MLGVLSDLPDASATENQPCSEKIRCPNAYTQNLAGCNAATGQCVCQRGYHFDRGVCMGESVIGFGLLVTFAGEPVF